MNEIDRDTSIASPYEFGAVRGLWNDIRRYHWRIRRMANKSNYGAGHWPSLVQHLSALIETACG